MLTCQNLTFHIIAHALGLVNILRKKSASNAHLPQTHKKTAAHAACLSRLPWSRMWVFTKFRFKERMTLFSIPCYHNRCHLSSIFCGFPASRLHFLLFPLLYTRSGKEKCRKRFRTPGTFLRPARQPRPGPCICLLPAATSGLPSARCFFCRASFILPQSGRCFRSLPSDRCLPECALRSRPAQAG